MSEFSFSSQEIASVIRDLGLSANAFGDESSERMKIVNCWDSCDVVACPGSGKTTVLLAKLLLLARKMPFVDGRGVCVLTHTNVAIDEIKNKLGYKSDVLFRHPNYFGTIQSFVDRFLAVPCGYKLLNTHFTRIDSEVFKSKLLSKFKGISWSKEFDEPGKMFYGRHITEVTKTAKGDEVLLKKMIEKKIDADVKNLYFDYKDNGIKLFSQEKPLLTDEKNLKHIGIKKIIEETLKEGFISYEYAYIFADYYVQYYADINEFLQKRFKYVFVDEMQDTQSHQLGIIEKIFQSNVVLQFYGDLDQAIFEGIAGGESAWKPGSKYPIWMISETKRFGSQIAIVATPFSREIESIIPNECQKSIKSHIILFDNPEEVLSKFTTLIGKYGLEKELWNKPNHRFNAVGFVGTEDEKKLTILKYYPNFIRKSQQKKQHFRTLISYFQKQSDEIVEKAGVKVYYESFMNALVELLYNGGSKNPDNNHSYTSFSLKSYITKKDEALPYRNLNTKISIWIMELKNGLKNSILIRDEFVAYFKTKIDKKIILDFNNIYQSDFVKSNTINEFDKISPIDNVFRGDDDINIKVGTVHSVKGETHVATLLLETENYGESETSYFQNQFCGKKNKITGSRYLNRLRVDYVALTRPVKLLCVALQNSKAKCPKCEKQSKCNWKIV